MRADLAEELGFEDTGTAIQRLFQSVHQSEVSSLPLPFWRMDFFSSKIDLRVFQFCVCVFSPQGNLQKMELEGFRL